MGEDVVTPLLLPSLYIFEGDIGGHVYVTAVAASTAGNISVLFAGHDNIWRTT